MEAETTSSVASPCMRRREIKSNQRRGMGKKKALGYAAAMLAMSVTATHAASILGSRDTELDQYENSAFIDFDEEDFLIARSASISQLPLLKGPLGQRRLAEEGSVSEYIKPKIEKVTAGGKLILKFDQAITFPTDIVEKLNANKDQYIILQTTQSGQEVSALPPVFPSVEQAKQAQEAAAQEAAA